MLRSTLAVLALTFLAPLAGAESPELIWRAAGIENVVCLEAIEDIDGDGGPDIVFESYDAGAPQTDHLICIRGASSGLGEVLWGTRPPGGPSSSGGYGDNCLRIAPDITGDGVQDVLLGTAWGGRSAYVLDGTEGDNIWWHFDTYYNSPPYPPESGWVYAIDALADFTGDGVPEVAFGCGGYNHSTYMMDGATGSVLWRHYTGAPFYDVRAIGDVNGDGADDLVATTGDSYPYLYCYSGPGQGGNPQILWSLAYPNTVMSLVPVASINADAIPDLVTACWDGHVRCHDGATGGELWMSPYLAVVVQRVALVGDVNGDEIDDLIAGLWTNKVSLVSGADGTVIWDQYVGGLNGGDTWAVDGVADTNFDGIPEVAVGSFDTKVYLMDGVDGAIIWDYTTGNRLYTVRGVPDLNGNGIPDVVAGTQKLSSSGGWVYALEGQPPSANIEVGPIASGDARLRVHPNLLTLHGDHVAWSLTAPAEGTLHVRIFGPDGRLVRSLMQTRVAAGQAVHGTWQPSGDQVSTGIFLLRAELDAVMLGGEKLVVVH